MLPLKKIFITGSSGFVGRNVISALSQEYAFFNYLRDSEIFLNQDVVFHFAGKATDSHHSMNFQDYFHANYSLTKKLFDVFLSSSCETFIFLSSVKAVSGNLSGNLYEDSIAVPTTDYGKTKLMAEQYIQSCAIPSSKRVYILRSPLIHGPGNNGNLTLLYKLVSLGLPWPFSSFDNKRSYCSISNLIFVLRELIQRRDIPSGVYNICDDIPISTNQIIELIANVLGKKTLFLAVNRKLIQRVAILGDVFNLPLNSENLNKLTSSYIVCNDKLRAAIGKPLPISSIEGLSSTILHLKKLK